ncbi:type VII secretion system (T7SS), usher family protein, partial [Klebsiella pneumoniae]
SAQIREILISESAWEEMTCLFAPSLVTEPSRPGRKTGPRSQRRKPPAKFFVIKITNKQQKHETKM